jgi:AraC-like DNA-binding protein
MIFLAADESYNESAPSADRREPGELPAGAVSPAVIGCPESLIVMAKAVRFIEGNLHRHLTLEDIAKHVGCSTRNLNRSLRKWAGLGPMKMLMIARMTRAAKLLLQSDRAPKRICEEVGVPWVGSFGRMFRRIHGVSPVRYRVRARQAWCDEQARAAGMSSEAGTGMAANAKTLARIAKTRGLKRSEPSVILRYRAAR